MKTLMTKEQAWEWYQKQPWIRGFNGYPMNCVNWIALWQEYGHEEVFRQVETEFQLAKDTGFNAVRVFLKFEVWQAQHDSFMKHFEEYLTLADKYGLGVMPILSSDCSVPRSVYVPPVFGEQHVDWGYHNGVKRGPHAGYDEIGYLPLDDPETTPQFYRMVDELAATYAKDPRIQIWNVWNEPGNGKRESKSLPVMEKAFEIIRSHDPIQPLTADVWEYDADRMPKREIERRACELSDVITFHFYGPFPDMVVIIENLKNLYGRPLINNEWLNRIEGNNVAEMFPLFFLERIGSYHWGLIAGYSQTYEPWGRYLREFVKEGSRLDLTKWQHDLYRMNGLPYDPAEIRIIKRFSALAAKREGKTD